MSKTQLAATRWVAFVCFVVLGCHNATFAGEPDWKRAERELITLLQELIRADTQNPPGNEIAACRVLKDFFDREGIASEIYKVEKGQANLLARLPGDGSQRAVLLVAHTDVVPAEPAAWTVDPLSGKLQDGYIYGRGALDDKGMLAVEALALALLKRQKASLRRDIILLASAGEETGGAMGVGWVLEHHRDKLKAAFALNEGGRIIMREGKPLYIGIQTEEKVAYNVKLIARGSTGHASVPRSDNAIYALAEALHKLGGYRAKRSLDPVTETFFRGIAPLDPGVTMAAGVVQTENALYLAMLSNTFSPTMLEGGLKTNVHPPSAEVNLNCRLLPGQDIGAFVDTLRNWIGSGPYEFDYQPRETFSGASSTDEIGFILIEQVCSEMFPGTPILPYLSPGMSDASRLRQAGISTYGLLPFPITEEELKGMHGRDERVSAAALLTGLKLVFKLAALAGK